MTPRSLAMLRRGLLGAVALTALTLVWTWKGGAVRRPPAATPSPGATPTAAARTENLLFKSFKGERQSFALAAQEMLGQEQEEMRLRGVDFTFSYVSAGQSGTGTITSETCQYNPNQQRAVFEGKVLLRTADGIELRTESLIYRGDKEVARSEAPVEFRRGGLSGRARGLLYHSQEGRLELHAEVFVRVEGGQSAATEIQSARAELARQEGTMRFLGEVKVVQGDDRLEADIFEVDFGPDNVIYRARAIENVRSASGGPLPGAATTPQGARGPRTLTCRKLDMWFAPSGLMKEAIATQKAELVLMPGPREPNERRRLTSDVLHFLFDEAGRLHELRTARGTSFEAVSLGKRAGGAPPARTLTCQRLLAKMDPASGGVQVIEFADDVVFAQGPQKAVARKAYYDGSNQGLYLVEAPEVVDEAQGSHLKAQAIDLATATGDVTAKGDVRHIIRLQGRQGGGLLGKEAPLQIGAQRLDYQASTRTGRYKDGALLRSGRDEVRGAEIHLQETGGQRRLEATGSVVALLHPSGEGRGNQPMEARSERMSYDEARRQAVFRGQVSIKQGELGTRSPEATLTLTEDGGGLETLVAGSPVEVTQGARRATGTRATYAPRDGKLQVVGNPARLKDPEQDIAGRSLTLDLADDRIVVHGQEQARTETVIRGRKEPKRP